MKYTRKINTSKISRRDFLKIAGITGGAAAMAACGSQETATTAPQPEEGEEEAEQPVEMEKVELTFWTPGGSDQYCAGFTEIAENYMKENPNISISISGERGEARGCPPAIYSF